MNLFQQFNIFSWKKPDLSEFYLATIFSFFIFQLFQPVIVQVARWSIAGLQTIFSYQISLTQVWYCLWFVCFFLAVFLKVYLIKPLGLKIDRQSKSAWETFLTFIIVFGFFTFIINRVFTNVPMPLDLPVWTIRLFDGWENTFVRPAGSLPERSFWAVIPWVWILAPILAFYYSVLQGTVLSKGSSEVKKD